MQSRRVRIASAILAAGFVASLSGCAYATETVEKVKAVLPLDEVGRHYLQAVCPINDAYAAAQYSLSQLRQGAENGLAAPEIELLRIQAQEALDKLAAAYTTANQQLASDAAELSPEVAPKFEKVNEALQQYTAAAAGARELSATELLKFDWGAVADAAVITDLRKTLGLAVDEQGMLAECQAVAQEEATTDSGDGDKTPADSESQSEG